MKLPLTRPGRIWLVVLVALAGALAALLLPPFKQPQQYHQFADQRTWLGILNFLNVLSNVGFLVVGLAGLGFLWDKATAQASSRFVEPSERIPCAAFFLGVIFTCFGSAYYPWQKTN